MGLERDTVWNFYMGRRDLQEQGKYDSQRLAISFSGIPDSCNLLTQVICSSAKSMDGTIINTGIIAAESDQLTIYILSHNLA
ncbi:HN1_G0050720.mRNA.1.CDS.1 [Saccharomyces cerevisiae]|nr:HN1_G0050720.mRNA.1.CDS.1 [Saccharomyces cerevisiae]CAI4428833.1 BAL_1a_G0017370.mRNA.1.CDS.1 [Saccharomyces cerevisiae]CAI7111177.1 BAL_1a_G0017370.mRNA.1.CDS.1 [Saccharomyces cerevisiae]